MANKQIRQYGSVTPSLTDAMLVQQSSYVTGRMSLSQLQALLVPGGVLPAWAGISAYRNTNQSFATGTYQKWLIDTLIGTAVNWTLASNRLTCGTNGRYLVHAQLTFDTQGDNVVFASIYKNGIPVRYGGSGIGNGAAFYSANVTFPAMPLVAGDYIEIFGRQDSGVNKTLPGQSSWAFVDISRVA